MLIIILLYLWKSNIGQNGILNTKEVKEENVKKKKKPNNKPYTFACQHFGQNTRPLSSGLSSHNHASKTGDVNIVLVSTDKFADWKDFNIYEISSCVSQSLLLMFPFLLIPFIFHTFTSSLLLLFSPRAAVFLCLFYTD